MDSVEDLKTKTKKHWKNSGIVCVCVFLCFHGLIGTGAGQHGAGFGWMYRWCLGGAGAEEEENRRTVPAGALLAAGCSHHSARWVGGTCMIAASIPQCVFVRECPCGLRVCVCECACAFAGCRRPNDNWHICCASLLALEPLFWPGWTRVWPCGFLYVFWGPGRFDKLQHVINVA